MDKLQLAFEKMDRYNRQDPKLHTWKGEPYPEEYFFAVKVYEWVQKLAPGASEELLLAARGHHIGRWEIPRETFPDGRVGYLNWRNQLAVFHADKVSAIMKGSGYGTEQIERVKQLILKKHIKKDPEVQVLENALCLVFLEFQYEDFRHKHPPGKIVNILRRSLLKMDQQGREQALKLEYSNEGRQHISEALSGI